MSTTDFSALELNQEQYNKWLEQRSQAMITARRSHFVTISREFGCDGYPTAMRLMELINTKYKSSPWLVFSHPIIEKLIGDEKLGTDMIHKVNETRYNFVNWFMDGLVPGFLQSQQSQAFERTRTLMLNLVEKGNCILIGGGAQVVTNGLDPQKFHGTHIRLIASYDFKIKSVMQKFKLDRGEAETMLEKKQYARDKFVEDFTGQRPSQNSLYHVIFNNDLNSPEMMAKTIFDYMETRGCFK